MTSIAIDGQNEEDFRRAIETDLRHGREQAAVDRLRQLLAPYAQPGGILPERFLTVTADDLSLRGWSFLGDSVARHDRPGRPVTAIGIALGWPGEDVPQPDADGRLAPHLETAYYNDSAYPFSHSGRDDLLDGYSFHGCTWAADCEATDNALSLDGADDLHGALARLEAQLLDSENPDEEAIRAGSLGACLLSALLFQTVSQTVARDGLPRPLCVTAGSNGVYPYFDAPVAGMPEQARRAAEAAEEEELDTGVPGPRYSSLLMTGIPRAQKRAVLVLAETESEMAVRLARLRGHGTEADAPVPADPGPLPCAPEAEPLRPAASAASPLLAKKPAHPAWDFRDMLSPRGPASAPRGAPPSLPPVAADGFDPPPPPAPVPEPAASDAPADPALDAWFDAVWDEEAEPAAPAAAVPDPAAEPPADPVRAEGPPAPPPVPTPDDAVGPGFPLLADALQDRLESLLSPERPLTLAPPAPEPEPAAVPDAPAVVADPWPAEAAGLAWPFAPEPAVDAPQVPDRVPSVPPAPAGGLLARLSAWIRRRR